MATHGRLDPFRRDRVPAASSSEKGTPLLDAASVAIAPPRILNDSIWGPTTEVAKAGCHGKLPINTDNRR
jgi:hypothetical protein